MICPNKIGLTTAETAAEPSVQWHSVGRAGMITACAREL